jgi:hypothetical protein
LHWESGTYNKDKAAKDEISEEKWGATSASWAKKIIRQVNNKKWASITDAAGKYMHNGRRGRSIIQAPVSQMALACEVDDEESDQ